MKSRATKNRFIELRAKGYSYSKIAKQLRTSKQTLINWGREYETEIRRLKEIELDELREKYYLLKENKIRIFGKRLIAIDKELDRRKYKDISTEKLINLLINIYKTFPEDFERVKKLTKEEIVAEQTQSAIDRLICVLNGEYEGQNQK